MKIAAVVVTYNRIELLKKNILSLRSQTCKLDEIIVVNNSSTDGTFDWLEVQTDLTVITQGNLGSGGGQHSGIKYAYNKGYDWIWCMDDDTIPLNDTLEQLLITSKNFSKISVISPVPISNLRSEELSFFTTLNPKSLPTL